MGNSFTVTARVGNWSLRGTKGNAPAAARSIFLSPLGCVTAISSGAKHGLAADSNSVAGDRVRCGAGEVSDGLGDIDGLTALEQGVESAADLPGGQRYSRRHLGLDEPRCDGVDGDAFIGEFRG